MIKIAPSLLASDFSRLGDEIRKVEAAGANIIHIDVMDGHFVPNITMGPPVVKCLRSVTDLPFDVHLMIENADNFIDDFIKAGADIISVHVENTPHINRTLKRIREGGAKPAVALNPSTSLTTLDWILEDVDMVLLMTVNPGFGGQSFIEGMVGKVAELKNTSIRRGLSFDIEVDGGISPDNIFRISEAGANVIVAGSTVFNAPDATSIIRELREKAYRGNA
ncbi:MAG: ribulose-phosphate 3-epimerase [Clostridiales bacterium]|nr:ribulose-phosphate 3-epimerase [Clostridiales bacterium]